jgi:hypothetical protein
MGPAIAKLLKMFVQTMTYDRFWALIDQARDKGGASADPRKLKSILDQLTDTEVLEFGHTFYERVCDLNQWRLWGAGYVIAGGMSDDSFHYFRSWIVGKAETCSQWQWKVPTN